jgi:hypothetical protein
MSVLGGFLTKFAITEGHRRLARKQKSLEQDMAKLAEANATELNKLRHDLDLETRSCTEYHENVRSWLHEVQETVASFFDEDKAQFLPQNV